MLTNTLRFILELLTTQGSVGHILYSNINIHFYPGFCFIVFFWGGRHVRDDAKLK